MTLTLLIDTNVWVDNYCADHTNSAAARACIHKAHALGHTLVYPAGCIKDVFYVLGHEFRRMAVAANDALGEKESLSAREAVWGCVNNICELATAVGVDEADVWLARKQRRLTEDLEDNLVLAAARRAQADYLVTSDRALIQHATVAALTPEDMLTVL